MQKHSISFLNAFTGIWTAVVTQSNIRIHFIIGSIVMFMSVYYEVSVDQVLHLILAIALVMTTEMINTSLEFLADAVTLEFDAHIKKAKDVAAGAVLISSLFAIIVGLFIFLPKII